jgi:hypothetical protein
VRALVLVLALAGCTRSDEPPVSIGVADCDGFLQHLDACIAQLGPSTTAGQALVSQRAIWRRNWAHADRTSLPVQCARARDEARRDYGACSW